MHVFDHMPATRIAIDWLWDDLKQLKFLNRSHQIGSDTTSSHAAAAATT